MYRFPFYTLKLTVLIASVLLASCGSEVEQETPSNGGGQLVASSSQALAPSSSPVSSSSVVISSSVVAASSVPALVQKSAEEIIDAQCASCHMGDTHSEWADLNEQQWLEAKNLNGESLIDPSNPENSLFLRRVSFYAASNSNMPLPNSAQSSDFTKEDYNKLVAWVTEIAEQFVPESSVSSLSTVSSSSLSPISEAASVSSQAASSSFAASAAPLASSSLSSSSLAQSSVGESSIAFVSSSSEVASSAAQISSSSDATSSSDKTVSSTAASSSVAQLTATQILDSQCTDCHSWWHASNDPDGDTRWLAAKTLGGGALITPQNIEASPLLVRMSFYGGDTSDMPPSDSEQAGAFTEGDYEVIRAWILTLAELPNSSAPSSSDAASSSQLNSSAEAVSSSAMVAVSSSVMAETPEFSSSASIAASSDSSEVESSLASSSLSVPSSAASSSGATSEGNSSAVFSSSVSTSAVAASSVPAVTQNAIEIIQDFCTSCHFGIHDSWDSLLTSEDWRRAQSKGESYINSLDPESSLILRRIRYYGEKTSTMPPDNAAQSEPFTEAHYDVLVEWAKSFAAKPTAPIEGSNVIIESAALTEFGFIATLGCDVGSELTLTLLDPESIGYGSVVGYDAVMSRESSFEVQDSSAVMIPANDGSFYLVGEGADIWGEAVYFNALRTEIIDGELDITLDVKEVSGVEHDFAKVGLMVSDSPDLSGQMVFVHWSGRHGLAEDSGEGALNSYRLIEANPVDGEVTPAPARIRIAYQNEALKVGACLGCDSPAIGAPKVLNFKPTHAFIVASSHEPDSTIEARLSLVDAYSVEGKYQEIFRQEIACDDGNVSWGVSSADVALDFDRLFVEAYLGADLVASSSVAQTFTEASSCEVQDQLLAPKLRRLSQEQIRNSIESVFGKIFVDDIWPGLEDGARLIGMNNTADKLNVNNLNFELLYNMVKSVSATLLVSDSLEACKNAEASDCVASWAQEYGARLWRRPLTGAELDGLSEGIAAFADNSQRLAFAIHSLLLSSNFYFRSEIGTLTDGLNQLTNYEMVSLLSYALVNTTPDDVLLTLAAQAEPLTASQLRIQAERLLALPAANSAMVSLYKDYLKLDLVLSRPKADSLGFSELVRADVLASAELTLADKIADNMDFTDVFLGNSFYVNSNIDYLFGISSTDATLTEVAVNGGERQGLLNHPAFLAVHSTLSTSGIVKRGVFALEQLLCQELPDPPGDVMPQPIPEGVDAATTSERELLQITHSAQAACIGCHQVIDPAGFGFENFDVIGRYRTEEKGSVLIDASGTLSNVGETVLTYNDSAEYASVLATSPQMRACVTRRFLEGFLGQNVSMQSCEVKKYQRLVGEKGGSVQDLLYALIELESFSKRQGAQ